MSWGSPTRASGMNQATSDPTEWPRLLAAIRGPLIGCDMVQSFARFGTEVTHLVQENLSSPARTPTPRRSCSRRVLLAKTGVALNLHEVVAARRAGRRQGRGLRARGHVRPRRWPTRSCAATGRAPNVASTRARAAGVRFGKRASGGRSPADHQCLSSTPARPRLALPASPPSPTPRRASLSKTNALFPGAPRPRRSPSPAWTYTTPRSPTLGSAPARPRRRGSRSRR